MIQPVLSLNAHELGGGVGVQHAGQAPGLAGSSDAQGGIVVHPAQAAQVAVEPPHCRQGALDAAATEAIAVESGDPGAHVLAVNGLGPGQLLASAVASKILQVAAIAPLAVRRQSPGGCGVVEVVVDGLAQFVHGSLTGWEFALLGGVSRVDALQYQGLPQGLQAAPTAALTNSTAGGRATAGRGPRRDRTETACPCWSESARDPGSQWPAFPAGDSAPGEWRRRSRRLRPVRERDSGTPPGAAPHRWRGCS